MMSGTIPRPARRPVYDLYGEGGLNTQGTGFSFGNRASTGEEGLNRQGTGFSFGNQASTFEFSSQQKHFNNTDDVLRPQGLFGNCSTGEGGLKPQGTGLFSNGDRASTFFGLGQTFSSPLKYFNTTNHVLKQHFPKCSTGTDNGGSASKDAPIESTLPCSLEVLYKGITKKIQISRDILHASGKILTVQEIITIDIEPGCKNGTKITFVEKGNERPGVTAPDLVFIVHEKPHEVFTRDGDDLIHTNKISLATALTGHTVRLNTIDGRTLVVPIDRVITPNYEEILPGAGMPVSNEPTKRGNLRIKFEVEFPATLDAWQKDVVKRLFP